MSTSKLYIGLMSGTSIDGIDAALVDFSSTPPQLIAHSDTPFPEEMRNDIIALCSPGDNEIDRCGKLDINIGKLLAQSVISLLEDAAVDARDVIAIGSHGQTVRHRPFIGSPFTLQIGDPNTIAQQTGITTVADFRRKDMAAGGQGAPLVPAFHQTLFNSPNSHATLKKANTVVVNIGGMANATFLQKEAGKTHGFDTGPGNTLLDAWIGEHKDLHYDTNGNWGATGSVNKTLLKALLSDPYFELSPPKSTGREYFNLPWLNQHLEQLDLPLSPRDVQATLLQLTTSSIVNAIKEYGPDTDEILVCGGGVHNIRLMSSLLSSAQNLISKDIKAISTAEKGINPDQMESMAFAWLAMRTLERRPGNLPSVTGACEEVVLGAVYYT